MPVKIRCRGCEKILNAPDKARGKVIQCPQCGVKMKVPGGQPSGAPPRQAAAAPAPQKPVKAGKRRPIKTAAPPQSDSDFFAALDFAHIEDTTARVCPYCAHELAEEVEVCPGCGMNVVTGRMDPKEARRRRRKGPDPAKFYTEAWTDSWAFVRKRKDLAIRTGRYLTIFVVLSFGCLFMVEYCTKGPPKTFWAGCSFLAMMGLPGWFFYLSMLIVEYTMSRRTKMDRVHFDFFQCVTLGMRTIFWPAVMLIPFSPIIVFLFLRAYMVTGEYGPLRVAVGALSVFPLLVLPLAIVHMTANYTYKAWVLWELSKVFVKNAGASLYWVLMALVTFLIPMGLIAGGIEFWGGGVNPFKNEHYLRLTHQGLSYVFGLAGMGEDWVFSTVLFLARFGLAFVVYAPVLMLAGFPLVFLMRANGLLGYYRQNDLDLVQIMPVNTPCGFWVRMLAFLVDLLLVPLAMFVSVKEKRAVFFGLMLTGLLGVTMIFGYLRTTALPIMGVVWLVYMWWMYFAVQESMSQRTTIGKDGFGLIVSTEDNGQLTLQGASARLFSTLVTLATLFTGFVMCAFHPEKKALHDLLSKTKVVWEGDR